MSPSTRHFVRHYVEHVAMLVSMLAAMLLRPAEYTHGTHAPREAVAA